MIYILSVFYSYYLTFWELQKKISISLDMLSVVKVIYFEIEKLRKLTELQEMNVKHGIAIVIPGIVGVFMNEIACVRVDDWIVDFAFISC